MKDEYIDVPFQVQALIESLRNRNERVHVRGNYRQRLDQIKNAIDRAIKDYDIEMGTAQPSRYKKGQR